jgi:kinesin family protein 4/21/27
MANSDDRFQVRPLVGQEKTHNVPKCITFVPDKPQLILGKDKAFTFDYVFQPTVTQVSEF